MNFIDLQVNGYLGIDFSDPNLTLDMIKKITLELASRGTIKYCPTLITAPITDYERFLPVLKKAFEDKNIANNLLGIHLEAFFFSDISAGAHQKELLLPPDIALFDYLNNLSGNNIKIVTLAPEIKGGETFIKELVKRDIIVAIGHCLPNEDDLQKAINAGAKLSTHLGNGIANELPRHPNPIWSQLAAEELKASVIPDGYHLPKEVLKVFFKAKGLDNIIAVSDSAAIAGLPYGIYNYMGAKAIITKNGSIFREDNKTLAGSGFVLSQCASFLKQNNLLKDNEIEKISYYNPLQLLAKL